MALGTCWRRGTAGARQAAAAPRATGSSVQAPLGDFCGQRNCSLVAEDSCPIPAAAKPPGKGQRELNANCVVKARAKCCTVGCPHPSLGGTYGEIMHAYPPQRTSQLLSPLASQYLMWPG